METSRALSVMRLASWATADALNGSCHCVTLDRSALWAGRGGIVPELDGLAESRKSLFSDSPVFVPKGDLEQMLEVVRVVESLALDEGVSQRFLADAPSIAQQASGTRGALMGYDFHLGSGAPQLIEINTNAGGAYLNALALDAQRACCTAVDWSLTRYAGNCFETAATAMFADEWRAERGDRRLRRVAIVDDDPEGQYLYPEFLLARDSLRRHGIDAVIADAADLAFENGVLSVGGLPVDLVYNRLTDFYLEQPAHSALRAAFLEGAVVLTPSPRHHAIYANKRNLVLLSDPKELASLGAGQGDTEILSRSVPKTMFVTPASADELWGPRNDLFFKPLAGHAGKAVYRGDKLTRKVWTETILPGAYIAQKRVPPSTRSVIVKGERKSLKMDVRLYAYAGRLLLAAARLYDGQTTNFRTPGGGFAPVCVV
jgi:hypothetical protein